MNMNEIELIFYSSKNTRSQLHLHRYLKLMKYYQNNACIKVKGLNGAYERHHILPRKLYPEYKNSKWNIIVLPTKAHYLAHYFLYKALSDKSCVYAFNQMRRISKKNGKTFCRLYESVRKEFAKLISENNTGKEVSESARLALSNHHKNTNIYRNKKTGELNRITVGQQPDGWEPFQTGRIRTADSKNKIREAMSSRMWQFNAETKEVKMEKELLPGFTLGYPDWYDNGRGLIKGYVWIHNPETKVHYRIPKHDQIPDGFVTGRIYNNVGFAKINQPNLLRLIDLSTKCFVIIDKKDFDPKLHLKTGQSLEKTFVYEYKNTVYLSYLDLINACPEIPEFGKRDDSLNHLTVPKPHYNMKDARKEFCAIHAGKTMNQIGLKVIKIADYAYDRRIIYVRCNSD